MFEGDHFSGECSEVKLYDEVLSLHVTIKYSLGTRQQVILQLCESSGRQRPEPHFCNLSPPSHFLVFNCFIPSVKTSGEKIEKILSSFENYDALPN